MSTKFAFLIRFTLEIFVVLVAIAHFSQRSAASSSTTDPRPEANPNALPGSRQNVIRLMVTGAATGEIRYRNAAVPANALDSLETAFSPAPDQVVVHLGAKPDSPLGKVLRYALDHDLPVSIELER
jgi:hypothetical protein